MIFAVDFDGTLCRSDWPGIGEPNVRLINFLKTARETGDRIILNTLREGDSLRQAVEWCKKRGLEFDAVNDNLPDEIEKWGNNPRKIYADCYIDDRNYTPMALTDFVGSELTAKRESRKG